MLLSDVEMSTISGLYIGRSGVLNLSSSILVFAGLDSLPRIGGDRLRLYGDGGRFLSAAGQSLFESPSEASDSGIPVRDLSVLRAYTAFLILSRHRSRRLRIVFLTWAPGNVFDRDRC